MLLGLRCLKIINYFCSNPNKKLRPLTPLFQIGLISGLGIEMQFRRDRKDCSWAEMENCYYHQHNQRHYFSAEASYHQRSRSHSNHKSMPVGESRPTWFPQLIEIDLTLPSTMDTCSQSTAAISKSCGEREPFHYIFRELPRSDTY